MDLLLRKLNFLSGVGIFVKILMNFHLNESARLFICLNLVCLLKRIVFAFSKHVLFIKQKRSKIKRKRRKREKEDEKNTTFLSDNYQDEVYKTVQCQLP